MCAIIAIFGLLGVLYASAPNNLLAAEKRDAGFQSQQEAPSEEASSTTKEIFDSQLRQPRSVDALIQQHQTMMERQDAEILKQKEQLTRLREELKTVREQDQTLYQSLIDTIQLHLVELGAEQSRLQNEKRELASIENELKEFRLAEEEQHSLLEDIEAKHLLQVEELKNVSRLLKGKQDVLVVDSGLLEAKKLSEANKEGLENVERSEAVLKLRDEFLTQLEDVVQDAHGLIEADRSNRLAALDQELAERRAALEEKRHVRLAEFEQSLIDREAFLETKLAALEQAYELKSSVGDAPSDTSGSDGAESDNRLAAVEPNSVLESLIPDVLPSAPPEPERIDSEFIVKRTSNVRAGPGTDYDVLGIIPENSQVFVLYKQPDTSWYRLRQPDGSEAFIHQSLIEEITPQRLAMLESARRLERQRQIEEERRRRAEAETRRRQDAEARAREEEDKLRQKTQRLSHEVLFGTWCGSDFSLDIGPLSLRYSLPNNQEVTYQVMRYEVTDDTVLVYWEADQERLTVMEFGQFSDDRQVVFQVRGRLEPSGDWKDYNRRFQRC